MGRRSDLEKSIQKTLEELGYTVYKTGWPDFLAVDPDGIGCFVEVKDADDRVWSNQSRMLYALHHMGLNVLVVGHMQRLPPDPLALIKPQPTTRVVELGNERLLLTGEAKPLDMQIAEAEKAAIQTAIKQASGKLQTAALILGITFESLRYRMTKLEIGKDAR